MKYKLCDCFHIKGGNPVCFGTKEQDVCSCNGDRTKCDFYPDVKEKATEQNRVVTAEEYRDALCYLYCGVTSATVNTIFNMPLSFSWSMLDILDNYTPTDVVDAVREYKKEYDVCRYEIFENNNADEDWLVTYVNYNTVYLINREGKTASMGKDVLLKEYKRTGETRYLQDFVM